MLFRIDHFDRTANRPVMTFKESLVTQTRGCGGYVEPRVLDQGQGIDRSPFQPSREHFFANHCFTFQRLLDMAVDPKSGIKKQDSNAVISGVAKNKVGRDLVWNWLRANWATIQRYFKAGIDSTLGDIISAIASDFNKEFELDELRKFYDEKLPQLGSGKRSTENAIQKTEANIEWMKKHYDEIVDWLERTNEEARNSENKF